MEFIDLKAQYRVLKDEINANIKKAIDSGKYIMGDEVKELEQKLCDYTNRKYCVTCANGTDALSMVLMAWDIKEGDAVFVPSFTFMSTGEVVSLRGATPVFVDSEERTFNVDVNDLEEKIKQTISEGKLTPKVIIPVDLFGICADYEAIEKVAKKYNLLVLEDAAQGFGGTINGKKACSFGEASTTSFFPAKPLGCYGDGGAIFTDDENLYNLLCSIRVHGKGKEKYDNVRIGVNSRLDTLQAAILLPKLKAFDEYEVDDRHKWAKLYDELLNGVVKTPLIPDGYTSSYAQYTILLDNEEQRNALQSALKEKGIPSMIYYPTPLHRQTVYKSLGYSEGSLPVCEKSSKCVLSLPMHPYLDEETVKTVSNAIIGFFK